MKSILAGALCAAVLVASASAEPAPDKAKVKAALNKVDVGFFLLLDKNEKAAPPPPPAETQKALNKVDVGFFLLLDKNKKHEAPPPAETQAAMNKVDVGFFLLLDKKPKDSGDEVELGRKLFFDPRLSSNKTMSCASCHNPSLAWRDGLPRARGINGMELARRTPSLLNIHNEQHRFFWDGRASTIEEATLTALQSRLEMNRDPAELVRELNRIPEYADRFVSVYGLQGITRENIGKAIASFVKTIRPAPTPFDRFRSDPDAMSAAAQRGLVVFTGKGRCVLCHTGPGLSNGYFHNTGVKPTPGVEDAGRYAVAPNPNDYRAFKTVPLRNVALTGPYMHNGSLKTLRDVVDFYNRGGDDPDGRDPLIQPLNLTDQEKSDLLAFLNALTSPQAPVALPVLPLEQSAPDARVAALWNVERAKMVDFDLKTKDRDGLAANAQAMRENVEAARRDGGADLSLASACLDRTFAAALSAESEASGKDSWSRAEKAGRALSRAADSCRGVFAPGETLAAADRVLGEAETSIAALTKAAEGDPRAGARCEKDFTVPRFIAEVSDKKIPEAQLDRIRPLVIQDLLTYYQYNAYAAMDPRVCDRMAPLKKQYFGIDRTAPWGCREWYWDMAAANALTTENGRFEEICRHSVAHDYPHMSGDDGLAICGIIAKNVNTPKKMCEGLVPRYMGPETVPACVNEFSRYSRDADIGKTQSGVPDQLFRRYVALDRYVRAYRGKDPSQCGDSELCKVLLGGGVKIADRYAAKIRSNVCGVLAAPAQADPSRSAALLDQGGELIARAESRRALSDRRAAAEIDARAERLARLRRRYRQALSRLPGGEGRQASSYVPPDRQASAD
jgi:cytochrome c peroxidase